MFGSGGPDHGHDGVALGLGGDEPVEGGAGGAGALVDGCVDEARIDRGDPDVGAVLGAQAVGVGGDGALGDRVGAGQGQLESGQEGGGDDHPTAAAYQVGHGGRGDPPGSEEVDLQGLVRVGVGHVPDVDGGADPGVVDEQVQVAVEAIDGLGHPFLDLSVVGDVAGDHTGGGFAVEPDDVDADVTKDRHGGAAERSGGAGDDGVLARETAQVARQGGRHVISSTVIAGTLQRALSQCNGV